MIQRTCAIIKPDAVRDGFIGDVISEISKSGMNIADLFMVRFTAEQAEAFYAEHKGRPFFPPLVEFTTSGPAVVLVLEGEDVVARWRQLIGKTDPRAAAPETLRARFGKGTPNNALHGSDSPESAEREISLLRLFR